MKNLSLKKYVKHLCVTNFLIFLGLIIYNLFSLFIPITRIRGWEIICVLVAINSILICIKLISSNK